MFKNLIKRKSIVLHNIIDVGKVRESVCDKGFSYAAGYVGRISRQKDPMRLLKIFEKIHRKKKHAKFVIAGEGEMLNEVRKYIKANNMDLYVDAIGRTKIPYEIMRSMRVMVMTSLWEGLPMAALECLCLGTPIVSTPIDGMAEIIEDGYNGFLSDNDDEIVRYIDEIIENNDLRDKLSDGAVRFSDWFNNRNVYKNGISMCYGAKG